MMHGNGSRRAKYGAGAFLCVWAALSAWVIGGVGEDYRKGLRREVASKANPTATPGPVGRQETPEAETTPPVATGQPIARASASPAEPSPSPPIVANRAPVPEVAEASAPVVKPPAPAPSGPIDPFWELPEQKKSWDLDRLTAEEERQLGLALHEMIRENHPFLEDGPLPRRLEDAAEPYLKTRVRKDVDYTLTVLDCACSNVFSHPGGYIYVCRGLFDWIAEDEDYALEFALAHEMAHVDLAHAINCLRDPDVKKLQLGTVPLFYLVVIPWGYKPALELEADRWAWERMGKLGRSRYESLAFLRKLEDYSRKNGFENKPKKPMELPKVPLLDNHIRTHPIPRERLRQLKLLTAPAPAPKP